MGRTEAYKKLTPHLPAGTLVSFPVIFSVLLSFVIQFCFQFFIFLYVQNQSFYTPTPPNPEDPYAPETNRSFENTSIFWLGNFQYLSACVAFSISRPFRKPLYTNYLFTGALIILIGFSTLLVLGDIQLLNDFFVFANVPPEH